MKKVYYSIFIFLACANFSIAQSILGSFPQLANQTIKLEGFNGLKTYPISNSTVDAQGNFKLTYSKEDLGMGYLLSADQKSFFVVLSGEDIEIKGEALDNSKTIQIVQGKENQWLEQYAQEQPKREQALAAWLFLENLYTSDALFSIRQTQKNQIKKEIQRINKDENFFLSTLPKATYVSWLLPVRKLLSSVSNVAQHHPTEIDATIGAFRMLDYSDSRLYKSGFFREAMESHFWLIENSGLPMDTVFKEMNISTDLILKNVEKNELLFNEILKHLFDYFEKYNLFKPSEYLSVKALSQNSCKLTENLVIQLESYRTMKIGNTASDIFFTADILKNGFPIKSPTRLSEINSKFKVVVFGASWCGACTEEMGQLLPLYEKWNAKGIEVVFISMDTDKKTFLDYVIAFPFISYCDYKKWDTQAAKEYYVSSSPTIYLLDKNNKIILRPKSYKVIDNWIDIDMAR